MVDYWRTLANSNANTSRAQPRPAFYLVDKPPAPAATSPPTSAPTGAADDAPDIPLDLRRKWMALLVEAVRRAKTLNVNFEDVTVSAHDVRAHQVFGYIRITDEAMRE